MISLHANTLTQRDELHEATCWANQHTNQYLQLAYTVCVINNLYIILYLSPLVYIAHSTFYLKDIWWQKCSETGHKVSGLLTRMKREGKSKDLNPVETSVSLHNCRLPAPHWHYHRAAALWALHHQHHRYYMGLLLRVCKSAWLWVLSVIMAAGCHTSYCQGH